MEPNRFSICGLIWDPRPSRKWPWVSTWRSYAAFARCIGLRENAIATFDARSMPAYADFAETNAVALARLPNVIVTRTLSKSYSLAGIRFGFLLADPALVRELNKVKDSYNCDVLSQVAAAAALEDQDGVARVGIVQQCAHPLVQHVGVEALRLDQGDTALPLVAFRLGLAEFHGERADLLVEILARPQPMVARIGIDPEIADQQGRQHIKAEGREERAKAGTGHHAGQGAGSALRRI